MIKYVWRKGYGESVDKMYLMKDYDKMCLENDYVGSVVKFVFMESLHKCNETQNYYYSWLV